MKIFVFLFLTAMPVLAPLKTSALDMEGQSRTYFLYRETSSSEKLAPLLEYLDFVARDGSNENISFHFGGWARASLNGNEVDGRKTNSDLQYAYLSLRAKKSNATLNLGRLIVVEGVASEIVDAVYARTDLAAGFDISAFGGIPVETDFDKRGGDSIYGGRISQGVSDIYRIGLSYLKEKNNSSDFREEEGIDLWLRPADKVEVAGRSDYNGLTERWMEHAYYMTLGEFRGFRLNTEVSHITYRDFFTSVSTSAFKLQSGIINPDEKVLITGGRLSYTSGDRVTISADYKNFDYHIAGAADYYGGSIDYSMPESWGMGASVHRMQGQTEGLKYNEYRIYAYKKFGPTDLVLDLIKTGYDARFNGVKSADAAVLAAGYNISKNVRIAADLQYSRNPFFTKDIRAFTKLIYSFSAAYKKGGKS